MALFYPSWLSNTPVCACMCESESHSVVSNSLPPHGLYTVHGILQARILEWVAVPFSRGSSQPKVQITSPALQADSLPAEPQESPRIPEWIAYSFSGRSSWPRNWTGVSCIAGGFFTSWATREARVYVCSSLKCSQFLKKSIHSLCEKWKDFSSELRFYVGLPLWLSW